MLNCGLTFLRYKDGESALMLVSCYDRPVLVGRLLAAGADVNATDKVRCRVLFLFPFVSML